MNLIVVSSLSCDEGLFFRYISMIAKTELDYSVLVEAKEKDIDFYYKKLKIQGWYDFVEDIVIPEWRIEGVRLDTEIKYPRTIYTQSISGENTLNLLGQIKVLRKI